MKSKPSCWHYIRSVRHDDLAELATIAQHAFQTLGPSCELLMLLERDGIICKVAVEGDVINGFALAELRADEIILHALAVHPDVQRRGVGRALINNFCDRLLRTGRKRLVLSVRESNTTGQAFAAACGMVRHGQHDGMFFDIMRQCYEAAIIYQKPVYDAGAVVIERILAGQCETIS